jgi:hypothetical protein
MKILDVNPPPSGGSVASTFESASERAFSLAESDGDLLEPVLIAWINRSTGKASPVLEGCSGQDGWHDYGNSHDGRLEIKIGDTTANYFRKGPSVRDHWSAPLTPAILHSDGLAGWLE